MFTKGKFSRSKESSDIKKTAQKSFHLRDEIFRKCYMHF